MSTNKTNFTGWSGSTFDITKLNFSGRTASVPQKSLSIVKGPVVITKDRPKKSKLTPGVKQTPVARVKSEIIFDPTKASKIGRLLTLNSTPLESTSLPFTAGTVDTSFPYSVDTGFDNVVYVSKVQSDGKILIGGDFTYYYYNGNSYYSPYLIRINSDGSPDFDFAYTYHSDDAGWMINGYVNTIDIQSDGKILIGGSFNAYSGGTYYESSGIMRFNSDGTFDDTLFVGVGFNNPVSKIIVQPDGKILVAGSFYQYNDIDNWRIIRLNSDGSPDSSFITGDGIDWDDSGDVYDMVLQPNGKIILGGDFYNYNGYTSNYIVRLNSNGSYDNTFVTGDGFNDVVYSLALQSDGKIIVGGEFSYYNNIDLYSGYIVRLGVNGEMDTRFGHGLDGGSVYSLTIQSDDKILVGGGFGDYYPDNVTTITINILVRFQSDCTFDTSFVFDSGVYNNEVYSITLDSDDKVYVGGGFFEDGAPYLLNRFGRLNNSILEYPYVYTVQSCTQPLSAETVTYVVGSMTELNPFVVYSFKSLQNPSITVCGFLVDIYPSNIVEYSMVNSYVDCEEAYTLNYKFVTVEDCITGEPSFWVVDNKYELGDILYINQIFDFISIIYVKFASKITTITPWSEYDGVLGNVWDFLPPSNYVPYASCNDAIEANGVHYVVISPIEDDVTFPLIHKMYSVDDIDAKVSLLSPTSTNPVKTLVDYLPYDEYSLISGGTPEIYSTVEFRGDIPFYESSIKGLTAMSPNGVLNPFFETLEFDSNSPFVYSTVEQPDGKLLVGGKFESYDGTTVNNFMRLNSDGTLDETFYLGLFNGTVRAITLQSNGKILVGGEFDEYDTVYTGHLVRLNSDGTIDNTFDGGGIQYTVRAIAIQRDNKILVGGDFTPPIIRVNSDGGFDSTLSIDNFGGTVYTIVIESIRDTPFYWVNNSLPTYTENIIVGGQFTSCDGIDVGGIVKLSPTGKVLPDFGNGFNQDTGGTPRVNRIVKQPDGKLIVIGGGYGNDILDYNETWIPKNIVRLVKVGRRYEIDNTFTTRNWDESPFIGGFGGAAFALTVLSNGKIMVGGYFSYYGDDNSEHNGISHLVRLNSDGTLDTTFTFELSAITYTTQLLSSGILLVGGRFDSLEFDRLLELCIGEEYELRSFDTCDGLTSNIFVPTSFNPEYVGGSSENVTELSYSPISTIGLDMIYEDVNGDDDDNFFIELPLDFDVNFLGINYTSVYVGTNSYITFGAGSDNYGIDPLPQGIPYNTGLPGVYLSTRTNDGTCLDSSLVKLYTGTTDGGNTTIIRFEGNHENSTDFPGETNLIYNFKFYKDQSNYFDIIIEQNDVFCNDDSTGGVSDGINTTWVTSFDSSSEKSYRITASSIKPIKANVNDRVAVCGTVGNVITTPQLNVGSGFTLFTATNFTSYNTCEDCNQILNTILYVRTGVTEYVTNRTMTKLNINNVLANGPIFTTGGVEAYEIINYYY